MQYPHEPETLTALPHWHTPQMQRSSETLMIRLNCATILLGNIQDVTRLKRHILLQFHCLVNPVQVQLSYLGHI